MIVDVDGGAVSLVRGELSGRFLFQVAGSEVRPYTCTLHHCSCPAYTNTVALSNDSIYVSHINTRSRSSDSNSSAAVTTTAIHSSPLLPLTSHLCPRAGCVVQCKHQLAARLCHALGRVRERVVSEADFNRLMIEDRYRDASAQHGLEAAHRTWASRQ